MSLFSMMRSRQTPERHCYKNCFPPPPTSSWPKPQTAKNRPSVWFTVSTVRWAKSHCLAGAAPHLFKKHALLFLKIDPQPAHPPTPLLQPTDTGFYDLVIYQPMEGNKYYKAQGDSHVRTHVFIYSMRNFSYHGLIKSTRVTLTSTPNTPLWKGLDLV